MSSQMACSIRIELLYCRHLSVFGCVKLTTISFSHCVWLDAISRAPTMELLWRNNN